MTTAVETDLNETIRSAVNARIEAAVLEALSGDEAIGKMVVAALQQPIEVPNSRMYSKDKVPYLSHVLANAIRDATKSVVERLLLEEQELIEAEVRKCLRRQAPELASTMVGHIVDTASRSYGVQVSLRMPSEH